MNKQLMSSASAEWYTPEHILERIRDTLGWISLDPAASPNAPAWNYAIRHYTKAQNGLSLPWEGRIFLNPPYGRVIHKWVAKAVAEFDEGTMDQGLLLLPARTDTKWMAILADFDRCYIRGRLKFSGAPHSAPFPSVVVAMGVPMPRFYEHFQPIGDVYCNVEAGL